MFLKKWLTLTLTWRRIRVACQLKSTFKLLYILVLQKPRRGVSFVPEEEEEEETIDDTQVVERIKYVKEEKPPCEDKGVWTGEPEYDTQLAIRLFRPPQLKGKN